MVQRRFYSFRLVGFSLVARTLFYAFTVVVLVATIFDSASGAVENKSKSRPVAPAQPDQSNRALVDREKRRLEELFIWKMSEELKLPVELETEFARTIRSLNSEKTKSLSEIDSALAAIDQAKTGIETDRAVRRYERAVRFFGDLPLKEVSKLRRVLGTERLSRYLVSKAAMAEKLRAIAQGQ